MNKFRPIVAVFLAPAVFLASILCCCVESKAAETVQPPSCHQQANPSRAGDQLSAAAHCDGCSCHQLVAVQAPFSNDLQVQISLSGGALNCAISPDAGPSAMDAVLRSLSPPSSGGDIPLFLKYASLRI